MAGESADEVARRSREKAERLLKRAEAFSKGATGERIVAETLAHLPSDWFVLNDRAWPGRSRANIDHVAVGPGGVFVIDAKNWSGTLAVKDGVLRQNGYSRLKTVEGALASVAAVAALFDWIPSGYFVPVVCFVGEATLDVSVNGVEICSLENLPRLLLNRPTALAPETLQFLRFDLDMSTRSASATPVKTAQPWVPRTDPSETFGINKGESRRSTRGEERGENRTPRLARFGLAFFWFVVGSLIFGVTLPAAHVSEVIQGALGFALLIGCIAYYLRKR